MGYRVTVRGVVWPAEAPPSGAFVDLAGFRCVERIQPFAGGGFVLLRRHLCRRGRTWWKRLRVYVGVDYGSGADRSYEVELLGMEEI